MSQAVASFSGVSQIQFNTCATKQSLLQPRTATNIYVPGSKTKKGVFLTGTRRPGIGTRPRAATTSWAAPRMSESLYETLGISENGTFLEIKKAYKHLARKFHPDVSPDPERVGEFTTRFIQIQEAYETLSDPKTRALYDRDMAANLAFGFGARKRASGLGFDEKGEWKNIWQCQLDGLERKSMSRRNSTSWGARMRRHEQA